MPLDAGEPQAMVQPKPRVHPLDRPGVGAILLGIVILAAWHWATTGGSVTEAVDPEYAALMGGAAAQAGAGLPSPAAVLEKAGELAARAFDGSTPGNLGIGLHLLVSLGRVALGWVMALAVGLPLGFAIGLSPRLSRALDPYFQILRPISPLAWMPLALYALKDSAAAAIFIIFISALWPILLNTAAGAAGLRAEWRNVARVFGLSRLETVWRVVLPATVPMILVGARLSIGIAWFVIVAAEMVGAQSGIGYFIWNEWNNLQIAAMIVAIFLIGGVGLALDQALAAAGRRWGFAE
ncbi:ABC transporter permease [Sabulicella rubraurantiaca]|uniref:ABC transporter permease n=1 Tax=Sabulicella rubraurantiaca TaxID=2811429 RepID=UPI002E289F0A|nr:ABC transporter permease [Sabulicella rubraurantiaca]